MYYNTRHITLSYANVLAFDNITKFFGNFFFIIFCMDSINERIKLLMNELGLNNNSFAKALGVSPTVTFNIMGGRENKPSYDFIKKLLFTFENTSPEWLIKGDGEMFSNYQVITSGKVVDESEKQECSVTIESLKERLKISTDTNVDLLQILKNMSERR